MPFYCEFCRTYYPEDSYICPKYEHSIEGYKASPKKFIEDFLPDLNFEKAKTKIDELELALDDAADALHYMTQHFGLFNISDQKPETPNTEIYLLDDTYNTDDSL